MLELKNLKSNNVELNSQEMETIKGGVATGGAGTIPGFIAGTALGSYGSYRLAERYDYLGTGSALEIGASLALPTIGGIAGGIGGAALSE